MRKYKMPWPKHNAVRFIQRFLWFPKTIGDETRWLEFACWKEEWEIAPLEGAPYYWVPTAWVNSLKEMERTDA